MMNVEGFERRQLWPEVLVQHLPGRTEVNHEKPQAEWLVRGPKGQYVVPEVHILLVDMYQ
jgi:hypothetical protein